MAASLFRYPVLLFTLIALSALSPAGHAEAQQIDDLTRSGRAEAAACLHKLAQMRDEARYYDGMKADLPGMEKQAAELQARLDALIPKAREASNRFAALEQEKKALEGELPKAEQDCREAWLPSLSGACSRKSGIARKLTEEVNPAIARLREELPPLEQERQEVENTLSVLQMNLQSRRNYVARATRPAEGQIAEQEGRCRNMELSLGRDHEISRSSMEIAASAAEGIVGDEIALRARLASPVPGARYGFVWSLNGRVFGGNGDQVKAAVPGEGTSTVRVVAWRWAGGQWVKAAEASRGIAGRARAPQTVAITGPSAVTVRNGTPLATFEARVTPEMPNEVYGFTWGATGGPGGPVTFSNHSSRQSLSPSTPGRYALLVHAWKLINGQWVFIGKAAHPFTVQ